MVSDLVIKAIEDFAETPAGQKWVECTRCQGSGEVVDHDDTYAPWNTTFKDCPRCFGKGGYPAFIRLARNHGLFRWPW